MGSIWQFILSFDVKGETDAGLVKEWDEFVRTKLMRHRYWLVQFDRWEMGETGERDWGRMSMSQANGANRTTDAILLQVLEDNGIVRVGQNEVMMIFAPSDVRKVPSEAFQCGMTVG